MLSQKIKEILIQHQTIGIFVSGGFDSALLLYLCHLLKNNNTFVLFTVARENNSVFYSKRVVDWIDAKFNINSKINFVGTSVVHHSVQVISGIKEAKKFPIDVIILGDTKNPPELPGGPTRPKSNDSRILQPFFEITKDYLIKEAITLGIQDLLDITGTCGRGLNPACQECWQCQEKTWALQKNNLAPPTGIEPIFAG